MTRTEVGHDHAETAALTLEADLRGDVLWESSRAFATDTGRCDSPHWRTLAEQVARRTGRSGAILDGAVAEEASVKVTRWQTVEASEEDLSTNMDGIFAGGDCMTGPDDAIRAIADGKKAAYAIHRYLSKGEGNE